MEGSHFPPGQGTFRKIGVQFWGKVDVGRYTPPFFLSPIAPAHVRLARPEPVHSPWPWLTGPPFPPAFFLDGVAGVHTTKHNQTSPESRSSVLMTFIAESPPAQD